MLSELRGALRGRTEPELADVLGTTPARVAAVSERLSAAGAIVRRGSRWFPA
jgi:DNA-binding MarR family transcriptional regulator